MNYPTSISDKTQRGFTDEEFEQRANRAQVAMRNEKLDALLLTTEPEIRYFTGFHTQFFKSPTRPWFVVLPLEGKPTAVIPEIGASGMASCWVNDVHTWASPQPEDDGISLLAKTIKNLRVQFGRIGVAIGVESNLRMPFANFQSLVGCIDMTIVDSALLLHQLRFIKSLAEIEKISTACRIVSDAFEVVALNSTEGDSEIAVCRRMKIDILERGADNIPYMVAGSGHGGYDSIIMGPTNRILGAGDILIIDTGTIFDGYFCDFDRNFAFSYLPDDVARAHETVYRATDAGFRAAYPGATTSDVWTAMWKELERGGSLGSTVGRMGHGLGMELTEWPSVKYDDDTVLQPGAILTLEPGMEFAPGKQLVHEENIVITSSGAEYLSKRAPQQMHIVK